jgi:thiamine-phosphate pyrophosphorylase
MNNTFPNNGLYVITQGQNLFLDTQQALDAGAKVVQYRDKSNNDISRHHQAESLQELCQQYSVPLIINDDVKLAIDVGAAGVHLGRDDGNIQNAREQLGNNKFIGTSCYNSLDLALSAQKDGANYVAFGRFFHSASKPEAKPADISLLSIAKQKIHIPIVAIGGITHNNGHILLQAGADLLAVINAVYEQPDPYNAALTFNRLFK